MVSGVRRQTSGRTSFASLVALRIRKIFKSLRYDVLLRRAELSLGPRLYDRAQRAQDSKTASETSKTPIDIVLFRFTC